MLLSRIKKYLTKDQPDGWVGVDLDATLAEYDGWRGSSQIGKPIPRMVQHVKNLLAQGETVKIFTARVAEDPKAAGLIQEWLVSNGLPRLEVTNEKDQGMKYLIDDRVKRVEPNTGIIKDSVQSFQNFKGLTIAIENPVGSIREGIDESGDPWKTKFLYPYGYIYGTKGADGEGVDCFIGPDITSDRVFIIHQTEGHGVYDEDKVMLGFPNKEQARDAYLAHYQTQGFLGQITEMPLFEFKAQLKVNGQTGNKIL